MQDNKPKVSILVPVYNAEKYLKICLDSLINQTLTNIEIICIDDGSTDNSLNILKKYEEQNNNVKVYSQENKGQGVTRNRLLELANGDYIGWVDADDWVSLDYYEKLYKACIEYNADVAIANTLTYFSEYNLQFDSWVNNNVFSVKSNIIENLSDRASIICSCAIWNKLYKKELVYKLPKFDSKLAMDDVTFNFGASVLANRMILVVDATYYYRMVETSIMHKINDNKRTFGVFTAGKLCRDFLNNLDIVQNNKKEFSLILDHFEVLNVWGCFNMTYEKDKKAFFEKMKKLYCSFNYTANPYKTYEGLQIFEKVIKAKGYNELNNNIKYGKIFNVTHEDGHKIITFPNIKIKLKEK